MMSNVNIHFYDNHQFMEHNLQLSEFKNVGKNPLYQMDNDYILKGFHVGDRIKRVTKQINFLKSVSNPCVISLVAIHYSHPNLYLQFPLYKEGDLQQVMDKTAEFNEYQFVSIASQILEGIQALHSANILHCDIKPQNIFVDSYDDKKFDLVIGDFDVSLNIQDRVTQTLNLKGTLGFAAPELTKVKKLKIITLKSDIYSVGKVLKLVANKLGDDSKRSYIMDKLISPCLLKDSKMRPHAYELLNRLIDFQTELQVSLEDTLSSMKVKHSNELKTYEKFNFPNSWENCNTAPNLTFRDSILLSQSSPDTPTDVVIESSNAFTNIMTFFSNENLSVEKIIRNENSNLWHEYSIKKESILNYLDPSIKVVLPNNLLDLKANLHPLISEIYLFHGTSHDAIKNISDHGFDITISRSRRNFGDGIYFTDTLRKAFGYAKPSKKGSRPIIISRVVLGNISVLKSGPTTTTMRKPGLLPNQNRTYDSVRGKLKVD
eukprot:CAMPEP_0117420394 /NCGR_PEP_ID=MMETSP0758-20121206/1731_1 /TAXON_ID=63605 /ORGANISM="Percolomonas cosmopolitus, Strain AE-1 (ATCC 50343)" /LENGTH=488 /DNA_ID=CAMNT_0005201965 /DNA_START=546 /DNA_END=2009 /DNA_ORIENTATION=+